MLCFSSGSDEEILDIIYKTIALSETVFECKIKLISANYVLKPRKVTVF